MHMYFEYLMFCSYGTFPAAAKDTNILCFSSCCSAAIPSLMEIQPIPPKGDSPKNWCNLWLRFAIEKTCLVMNGHLVNPCKPTPCWRQVGLCWVPGIAGIASGGPRASTRRLGCVAGGGLRRRLSQRRRSPPPGGNTNGFFRNKVNPNSSKM